MKRRVVVKWTTALLIVFIAMGVAPSHPSGPCDRRYVRFHLRRCKGGGGDGAPAQAAANLEDRVVESQIEGGGKSIRAKGSPPHNGGPTDSE